MSKSIRLRVSISGEDPQGALLKLKLSAETEMPGKKLKLTGPEIFKSLPVAVLTEVESNLVNCTGSTVAAAYHTPSPSRTITALKLPMMILTVLLIVIRF